MSVRCRASRAARDAASLALAVRRALFGLLASLGSLTLGDSAAAQTSLVVPRVRTENSHIATALEEARSRSATFRELLDTINRTDGLVYIEEGECPQHVPGCMIHAITIAGPSRVLHVKLDPRRSGLNANPTDPELLGTLGHELQHVIEVLRQPELRRNIDLSNFYRREGTHSSERAIETAGAVRIGIQIAEEVKRAQRNQK